MKRNVKEEIVCNDNAYNEKKKINVPSWLIFLLLKYWAAAAAVFFSVIGGLDIGLDFSDTPEDRLSVLTADISIIVIIALCLALVMSYIVRPIIDMCNNPRKNTYQYNMINVKGFKSFILSLFYNLLLSIILYCVIVFLGSKNLIPNLFGTTNYGIEPFSYGFCYIVIDGIFLTIKNLIVRAIEKNKYKKQMEG